VGKLIALGLALIMQVGGLLGAHLYYSANPRDVLIVVDTSYGMSAYQTRMAKWLEGYENSQRYRDFHYATDKSYLGPGAANRDKLYRVSFGSMEVNTLEQKYPENKYSDRILLTFTVDALSGWLVIHFEK
jgi:hypothetical protein|tara:strand:+ start:202 stop:591 length:390 start_codon:yes stop_codon:yes gene_type:complete